ncbi:MAG: DUF4350 domain-containing protein [Archangium sp.]
MNRGQLAIGGLVLLALVVAALARQPGSDSPLPSITNSGPRGAAVLATWLRESGVDVVALDEPFAAFPPGLKTVVIAAPSQSELTSEETKVLQDFVQSGGTLVFLAPRDRLHPAIANWLELHSGEVAPLGDIKGIDDVGGTTVNVRFQGGATSDVHQLRISAERMIEVKHPSAVMVAEHSALWFVPIGSGEVWVGAGPDLIENARLELLDNARFWSAIASRGPIAFDEYHLLAHEMSAPRNLLASGLQLLVLAALFLWARAPRLGPVREEATTQHRSALEYVRAMATLTANAKVEGELITALKDDFRRRIEEELGIARTLPWPDAARELERRAQIPAAEVIAAAAETRFLPLSRALASLDRRLSAA